MKKTRILFMVMLATLFIFTGCGSKKESKTNNETADKRLEKSLKAYSLDRTVETSSDEELVDNVTVVGKISAKMADGQYVDAKANFKIDFSDRKLYLGLDAEAEIEDEEMNFNAELYFVSEDDYNSKFYVRADEYLEDWVAVTLSASEDSVEYDEDEEEFNLDEMLKIDFDAFKDVKEVETKNGLTKIETTVDLSDSVVTFNGSEASELKLYFYLDEDDRISKIEFDSDSMLEYINSIEGDAFKEFNMSFEFKDYGKTTIEIPSKALNTDKVYSMDEFLEPIITALFGGMDYDYDDDYDWDFDDDDDNTVSIHGEYDSSVDGFDNVEIHTY